MVDILTREKRSWNMSRIKGRNTKPEVTLRSFLHRSGLRFRLHDKRLHGRADIVLPRYRTVVFVNGCFWHRHDGCRYAYMPKTRVKFWTDKFERTVQRDMEQNKALAEDNWRVFTAWECEIKESPNLVLGRIKNFLKEVG